MSDITMCGNAKCPVRLKCWRAQAPASSRWQSYAMFDNTKVTAEGVPECLWVRGEK